MQATVASVKSHRIRPKLHKTDVVITDGRSRVTVTFFNQPYRERSLTAGQEVFFAGKVEVFRGRVTLTNPEVAVGDDAEEFAGGLHPRLPRDRRAAVLAAEQGRAGRRRRRARRPGGLPRPGPGRAAAAPRPAVTRGRAPAVHRPDTRDDVSRARRRLRYDEAFVLQTILARRRAETAALPATPRPWSGGGLLEAFDARLPFTLTAGQRAVADDIAADLAREHPMHRLLQGEVGSGKTVVALRAMLAVVDSGGQAALLAPTEVLAQQHHRSMTAMLGPLAERGLLGGSDIGTRVALLTGSQPTAARRSALLDVVSGDAGIVVGTHALIQDAVDFHDLGLVVVDEQHRFGVEQRDALRSKAKMPPHVLVMTATPDPADRRDDRLRRPGRVDAHRAAGGAPADHVARGARPRSRTSWSGRGTGSARRWPAATRSTWCARGSATARAGPGRTRTPATRATSRWTATRTALLRPGGRRWRCSTWRRCWPRDRWPACASR